MNHDEPRSSSVNQDPNTDPNTPRRPSREELAAAAERHRAHAARLRRERMAIAYAGQLLEHAMRAAIATAPHLLERLEDLDHEAAGRRIFDGVMRAFRKR